MLSEFRTTLLSPKMYYQLYIEIFDNMKHLEWFFKELHQKGKRMKDLYESVQHAGHVIPRIYLLITVGSVWIETHEMRPKEILLDLLEMVKSVQNPLKGLFVRYYLNQMVKDYLPVSGSFYSTKYFLEKELDRELSEEEVKKVDLEDMELTVDFILTNLQQMNRLWIRVQYYSTNKDDRRDLETIIGDNFTRLANIDCIDLDYYKNKLFPRLADIINICKDSLVQQYMSLCIIKAFPDEYHIASFKTLIDLIKGLNPDADLKSVLEMIIQRFTYYAQQGNNIVNVDVNVFNELYHLLSFIIDKYNEEKEKTVPIKTYLSMVLNLINFVITCYSDKVEYIGDCLILAEKLLRINRTVDLDATKIVVKILTIPLDKYHYRILTIRSYPEIMSTLNYDLSKDVACKIIKSLINNNYILKDMNSVENIVRFIEPLLKQPSTAIIDENNYFFKYEDTLLSKLVHLIHPDSISEQYNMLSLFKNKYNSCGDYRFSILFTSICQQIIKILNNFVSLGSDADDDATDLMIKIVELVSNEIDNIKSFNPDFMVRTLMDLIMCLSRLNNVGNFLSKAHDLVYQMTSDMLTIYEEDVVETETKLKLLQSIISCLYICNKVYDDDDYDTFVGHIVNYSAKMLKRKHQATQLIHALFLFGRWNYTGKKFSETVKKLKKVISSCKVSENVDTFIYVLVKLVRLQSLGATDMDELKQTLEEELRTHNGVAYQKRTKEATVTELIKHKD